MKAGRGRVLVTTAAAYRQKVAPIRDDLPDLEFVLLVGEGADAVEGPGVQALAPLMAAASADYAIAPTDPEDMSFVHFTSGTTGTPKGAVHAHDAVVAHYATGRYVLDLREGDVYWCTADPGWVTGTSYGVVAPLTCGVTCIVDEAEFDAVRWYTLLEQEHVTVWYTAPTALRMLMKAGDALAAGHDLSGVRHAASVGEPLNPGGGAVGRPRARAGDPRHVVADRDRRDHGRERRRPADPAGVHGQAGPRDRARARCGTVPTTSGCWLLTAARCWSTPSATRARSPSARRGPR